MDINIREYELQLQNVEQSLQATTSPEEKTALNSLKSDLLELIDLTKQSLDANGINQTDEYSINEELDLFKREMENLNCRNFEESNDGKSNVQSVQLGQELKLKLENMVGQKCSAPHQHSWGAKSYHNAIVCGIENTKNVDNNGSIKARLRVLFTNPTHREMLPCSFYLEGECRFDDEHCHFSHGELIDVEALGPYVEPDFSRLARNCVVLAKLPDRLWHRGRVLCANFIEKECRVRLDRKGENKQERDLPFEDLLPIFHDDDLSSGSSSESCGETDLDPSDDLIITSQSQLVEKNLFQFKPTQPIGEWEKHTRGIGSKLMAKMGYINGRGLGIDGNGIVIPVTAQILPQGCSLDRCMELREAANGDKDLFSVVKKMQVQQKRQENLNARAYERECHRTDVFSFLNDHILSRCSESKDTKNKISLKNETTKSLNVASVKISDDIRRKEKEIANLQQALGRNIVRSDVYKRLQQQIDFKSEELKAFKKEEESLSREQASRKTKNKLFIF